MKDLAVTIEPPSDADPFWFGFDDVRVPGVVLIRKKKTGVTHRRKI